MAKSSYLKSLIGGLPPEVKVAIGRCWDYLCDGNIRFGPVEHQTRADNFAGVYVTGTTHATSGAEFSVVHGLGDVPNVILPVLDPRTVGSRLIGDLTISRAPDGNRLYLTSTSTGATFALYVER